METSYEYFTDFVPPCDIYSTQKNKQNRWKKVLQPGLNKGHWTREEDEIVRAAVRNAEIMDIVSILPTNWHRAVPWEFLFGLWLFLYVPR